jgi:hypothetical protein|tara:strand:+ start:350 stop:973 length:624 start_codon:yes stop_codon:yes gene_type:complete
MDLIRILEVLVTSVTSIVIALVGAGFFRRMSDKQEKNRSKVRLMEQIKKDEIVHLAIRDVRRRYNADRVYIWQFHNGGSFYTTSPMQKLSITYERCSDGLERKAEKNQNHLITSFTSYITDTMNGIMYYPNIEDMSDIGLRSLSSSSGTKGHCAVPIYDKEKHLVAILCLDWVFSPIPEEFIKKDGKFTQDFIDEFSTDADTLDTYL